MQQSTDTSIQHKTNLLQEFKCQVVEPTTRMTFPFDLSGKPKYSKMETAAIIEMDNRRIHVIDVLLTNLYTVYVLLIDRSFYDAFVKIFINICIAKEFNEFMVLIKHTKILALLLLKMDKRQEAIKVYEFL